MILADFMGLGKTLQVASYLTVYLSKHAAENALILCPASVMRHWEREFSRIGEWIMNSGEIQEYSAIKVKLLNSAKTADARLAILEELVKVR